MFCVINLIFHENNLLKTMFLLSSCIVVSLISFYMFVKKQNEHIMLRSCLSVPPSILLELWALFGWFRVPEMSIILDLYPSLSWFQCNGDDLGKWFFRIRINFSPIFVLILLLQGGLNQITFLHLLLGLACPSTLFIGQYTSSSLWPALVMAAW